MSTTCYYLYIRIKVDTNIPKGLKSGVQIREWGVGVMKIENPIDGIIFSFSSLNFAVLAGSFEVNFWE